jgi:hypothetical protein
MRTKFWSNNPWQQTAQESRPYTGHNIKMHIPETVCELSKDMTFEVLKAVKMEVVCSSKTVISSCKTTWRHNPDDRSCHRTVSSGTIS